VAQSAARELSPVNFQRRLAANHQVGASPKGFLFMKAFANVGPFSAGELRAYESMAT
jgi:hypothetical protein